MKPPQKLPATAKRVESGAVQFGDDWPGVFIRGDHALLVMVPQLRNAANLLRQIDTKKPGNEMVPFVRGVLIGMAAMLLECDATGVATASVKLPEN